MPLLQLIIVPGEVDGLTDIESQDYITPHLNYLYSHQPQQLVRHKCDVKKPYHILNLSS